MGFHYDGSILRARRGPIDFSHPGMTNDKVAKLTHLRSEWLPRLRRWAAPRHCLARGPSCENRAKFGQIYRLYRLLARFNCFRINSRREDSHRVKMALYR